MNGASTSVKVIDEATNVAASNSGKYVGKTMAVVPFSARRAVTTSVKTGANSAKCKMYMLKETRPMRAMTRLTRIGVGDRCKSTHRTPAPAEKMVSRAIQPL